MSYNKPLHRIAIVGTGVIGASWAAEYLARGFDVVATDPAPNAEANLRKYIDNGLEGPDMSDATPVDSLIASSSFGITPSVLQSKCNVRRDTNGFY